MKAMVQHWNHTSPFLFVFVAAPQPIVPLSVSSSWVNWSNSVQPMSSTAFSLAPRGPRDKHETVPCAGCLFYTAPTNWLLTVYSACIFGCCRKSAPY
ncbi:hypothetical protein E2C01_067156 [Portunus trituberculatus]|uniref:Uncharacterized protein n=1 Tax=Portunus trituberculatus TaxID=210409 RepID=A0A5B7HND5_PORTR|nr:hypothetical protein [Portunus trituberculatus]